MTQEACQKTHHCSSQALQLLGDFWTLSIIDVLKDGELRYCSLQRALNDVSPVTLAGRLKKLEQAGLVERKEEAVDKLSVSYALTKNGESILPVLEQIQIFSESYSAA